MVIALMTTFKVFFLTNSPMSMLTAFLRTRYRIMLYSSLKALGEGGCSNHPVDKEMEGGQFVGNWA